MKITINDGDQVVASGTEGDAVEHRDAGAEVERSVAERNAEERVWGQQQSGEVGTHTVDLSPSPGNPESGLPHNAADTEFVATGDDVDAEVVNETQKKSDLDSETRAVTRAAANAEETVRAASEHDEKFLRLAADFENYKRQVNRREAEVRARAARGVLEDLLPVLDNFDRALDAARNSKDVESVRIGVEFIAQQLRDTLKNHGVESIESTGKSFDPMQHDALEEVVESGHPEGTVVEEVQRGYTMHGQVLRPSRVRVAGKN